MSCNSAIYASSTSNTTISAGQIIPMNTIIRKYGCALGLLNNGIKIGATGYYEVNVTATFVPSAAGTYSITIYKNGVALPNTTVSVAGTASEATNLNISAIIRHTCCCQPAYLTIVTSGQILTNNITMTVQKL